MTPTELGREHGQDYAVELWHADPADYDTATEWCLSAEAGTRHDYYLPSPFDETPDGLDAAGWSSGELADYENAWTQAYLFRTTELMRGVLDAHHDRKQDDHTTECEICGVATVHVHDALGPDNDGNVRLVEVCCECMESCDGGHE